MTDKKWSLYRDYNMDIVCSMRTTPPIFGNLPTVYAVHIMNTTVYSDNIYIYQ